MLSYLLVFSTGREKVVETFTLLDHHFWLSGQGVAGHHPPMAEWVLALAQHPAGPVTELGLAMPRERSDS